MAGFMRLQVWQEAGATFLDHGDERFYPLSYGEGLERARRDSDGVPYDRDEPTDPQHTWWAEYSAPGYLDRTDPVSGKTAVEAARECFDLYGDPEDPAERSELASVLWRCRRLDRQNKG